jgi:hypothetical protein
MEVASERRTWVFDSDAFEAARRCIAAAYTERDPATRQALGRAARRYLERAGMRLPGFPTFSAEKTPLKGERPARC